MWWALLIGIPGSGAFVILMAGLIGAGRRADEGEEILLEILDPQPRAGGRTNENEDVRSAPKGRPRQAAGGKA